MAVRTLPFIEPKMLTVEKRGDKSPKEIESVNYWSSLNNLESKHDWLSLVMESINTIIKDEMTQGAFFNLKNVMENFVDENLSVLSDHEGNFGLYVLYIWMGYDEEDVNKNEELKFFADELQDFYEKSDSSNLYVNITTLVMVRYLEAVVNFMLYNSHHTINLFHCLYVQQTDPRFTMFKYENVAENLIPIQPSLSGFTVDRLRIDLAEFIKTKYSQLPSLENGVLNLLAGSSNIILLNEQSTKLANNIRKMLNEPRSDSEKDLFFTLHKLILYLTFESIQARLSSSDNKMWTVEVVLDSLNEAAERYNRIVTHS
jgi:hypothetical protein